MKPIHLLLLSLLFIVCLSMYMVYYTYNSNKEGLENDSDNSNGQGVCDYAKSKIEKAHTKIAEIQTTLKKLEKQIPGNKKAFANMNKVCKNNNT